MSEEITPTLFESYPCSLGLVLDHGDEGDIYRISTPSGQVIGIRANTTPSIENVEADIANPAPAPAVPVPHEVPLWAIRAVLDLEGLTASINSILAQLPEPDRTVVNRVWEYGNYIRRDSPTISQLTVALGKTTEEVDGYFRQAAALNP
jgi:hypothetical protein